jgi:hypothetical protein
MVRTLRIARGLVICGAVLAVTLASPRPASAQVVQSVQIGIGAFFPRGFDTRVTGDTLVADLTDQNPLLFVISDFRAAQVNGEWNVSFGPHVEIGAGLGYYQSTVHSVYRDLVNSDGSEIRQDLRLRIAPITGVVRFLPFGDQAHVQPYVGVGIGAFNFRYSETGQFVDPSDYSVYTDSYTATGTPIGPIVLGGVRIPIKGDIYGFSTEYRYQWVSGDTGGIAKGFLGDKIDLSGGTLNFAFLIRF